MALLQNLIMIQMSFKLVAVEIGMIVELIVVPQLTFDA